MMNFLIPYVFIFFSFIPNGGGKVEFLFKNFQNLYIYRAYSNEVIKISKQFRVEQFALVNDKLFLLVEGEKRFPAHFGYTTKERLFYTKINNYNNISNLTYNEIKIEGAYDFKLSPDNKHLLVNTYTYKYKQPIPGYAVYSIENLNFIKLDDTLGYSGLCWFNNNQLLLKKGNKLTLFNIKSKRHKDYHVSFNLKNYFIVSAKNINKDKILFRLMGIKDSSNVNDRLLLSNKSKSKVLYIEKNESFHSYLVTRNNKIIILYYKDSYYSLKILNINGNILYQRNIRTLNHKPFDEKVIVPNLNLLSDNTLENRFIYYNADIYNNSTFTLFDVNSDSIKTEYLLKINNFSLIKAIKLINKVKVK